MARKPGGTIAAPKSELAHRLRTEGYFPISEVATRIGLHKSTIYRWVQEKIVEYLDFGGAYYVKWSSVVEHMGVVADILDLDKSEPQPNAETTDEKKSD